MERRGRIILISLFILTIFFTGCKKDEFFETKKDSKNKEHYDNFNKAKKEKEKEKEKEKYNHHDDYGSCQANENESYSGHGRKITICHNGHMITISVNAVLKHFNNHSTDRLFACDGENSVAYADIECTLKYIMAQKHLNPNSKYSLQRAFNVWIDEYFLAGKWPSAKVNCDGSTGGGTTDPGTGGGTTDPGTGTGGGTTDPGTGTGGGTTDPGTGTGGSTTDPGTGTGGGTTADTTPTIPVCHNGAILDQDYLTAYVNSQDGDLLIACEFAAGAISYYDIEGTLLDIIYDYGLDATAPDVMFQAFVIWYQDYYLTGNWPPAAGGAGGGGAGDGGSGTGSDGTVIITN